MCEYLGSPPETKPLAPKQKLAWDAFVTLGVECTSSCWLFALKSWIDASDASDRTNANIMKTSQVLQKLDMYCPQLYASKCYGPFAGMRIVREVRRSAIKTAGTGLGALLARCPRLALSFSRKHRLDWAGGFQTFEPARLQWRAVLSCRCAHECAARHVLPAAVCEQMLRTFCQYAHRARSPAVRHQNCRHRAGRAFDPPGALC